MKTNIKKAIICKHIQDFTVNQLIARTHQPRSGDVGIFRVLEIGKHKAIQSAKGTNAYIFPGDLIMCTFGNRYASAQFEGYVPEAFRETYEILGQGGVVGTLTSMHAKFDKVGATTVELVGYAVSKSGEVINTHYLTEKRVRFNPKKTRPYKVVLSVGASMDSGKTTSAAYLCRGLRHAGRKVAFIKLTGTVFSKDKHFVHDCGAHKVVDFSNLGYPSTYMYPIRDLLDVFEGLLRKVEVIEPDYVVVEIADGLFQRETKMLLENYAFRSVVNEVMYSCADSMSVQTGIDCLEKVGLRPFGVSGLLNASPLMVSEAREVTELPILGLDDLMNPSIVQLFEKGQSKIA